MASRSVPSLALIATLSGYGVLALLSSCSTAGNRWISDGSGQHDTEKNSAKPQIAKDNTAKPKGSTSEAQRIIDQETRWAEEWAEEQARRIGPDVPETEGERRLRIHIEGARGQQLGLYRNTYYDFPQESDFSSGEKVMAYSASCEPLGKIDRAFHDALCVQGSGQNERGTTLSFAKRDCSCAQKCPKTDQKICYEALDASRFPWGRGAMGQAITPLLTIAVDSNVIPLGTAVYIPEFDGVPRDASRQLKHDGCFIAQDRGIKVEGKHLDVFTGDSSTTALWNRLVPSNQGVHVILDNPRCKR